MTAVSFSSVVIPAATVADQLDTLRFRLTGELITSDSIDYDTARTTIFGALARPLAFARVANAEDVVAVVTFAQEHGIPLSVRSGGHSLAWLSVVDGALVVDFTRMKLVMVDPETRTARVQPGATSGDLAGPANAHGLALTTGDTHSVGMGGLVTGGGIGFIVRKYGLAIDNLLSAQVVTAAGEIVTASETEHPDLFWAIRGGGGNAGIVTEFTFQLAPVGQVLGGDLMLPATPEVIRGYLDYVVAAPEDLTTIANLEHAPPAPHVPPDRVGELVLSILLVWTGDLEAGERALAPLRALADPVADAIAPMPYPGIYDFTAFAAEPHNASIRSMFADAISDDAIAAILTAMDTASSPFSLVQLRGLGGAFARVDPDATAFAHRDRNYFVAIIGIWADPEEDRALHEAWTAALWEAIRHEGQGVYVNFLEEEGEARIREAYPEATYTRLARVKAAYDPENLFRHNQNVPPKR